MQIRTLGPTREPDETNRDRRLLRRHARIVPDPHRLAGGSIDRFGHAWRCAHRGGDDSINDALGELCNMLAGGWKNEVPGLSSECALSPPTVISGRDYKVHLSKPSVKLSRIYQFRRPHAPSHPVLRGHRRFPGLAAAVKSRATSSITSLWIQPGLGGERI